MKKQFGSYTVEGAIIYLLLPIDYILKIFFTIVRLFCKKSVKIFDVPAESIRNILVMEIVGMGDAVLATSIIRPLKVQYTNANITFLGNPKFLSAVSSVFDATIGLEAPWVRKKSKLQWIGGEWRNFFQSCRKLRNEKFDLCFDARCDFRSGWLCYLIGAKHRIGFDYGIGNYFYTETVKYGEIVQRAKDYQKLLNYINISAEKCVPYLVITEAEKSQALSNIKKLGLESEKYYLIHPGAARKYKKYPLMKLSEIIVRLQLAYPGLTPLAIGGNEDAQDLKSLQDLSEGKVSTRFTTIEEAMGLIYFAKTLLCNNTGVMHIAAALGKKTVVFMGPTDERIWSPMGEGHLIFQESMGLECHPCGEEICVRPESPCIDLIEPDKAAQEIISSGLLD